jgi:hypothetical protein
MIKIRLITWMLCFAAVFWATAQQTNVNRANPHTVRWTPSFGQKNAEIKLGPQALLDSDSLFSLLCVFPIKPLQSSGVQPAVSPAGRRRRRGLLPRPGRRPRTIRLG